MRWAGAAAGMLVLALAGCGGVPGAGSGPGAAACAGETAVAPEDATGSDGDAALSPAPAEPGIGLGEYRRLVEEGELAEGPLPETAVFSPAGGEAGALFAPVLFPPESCELDGPAGERLAACARYLRERPGLLVLIVGHCDSRVTGEYALSFGRQRAQAVRKQLALCGIAPGRLFTESRGADEPADPSTGEAAWQRNRRCEFFFARR